MAKPNLPLISVTNYEVYALIEGRVKYRHMFRYTANRENAWK